MTVISDKREVSPSDNNAISIISPSPRVTLPRRPPPGSHPEVQWSVTSLRSLQPSLNIANYNREDDGGLRNLSLNGYIPMGSTDGRQVNVSRFIYPGSKTDLIVTHAG